MHNGEENSGDSPERLRFFQLETETFKAPVESKKSQAHEDQVLASFALSREKSIQALKSALIIAHKDQDYKPHLACVFLYVEEKQVRFVSTDGFMLCEKFEPVDHEALVNLGLPKGVVLARSTCELLVSLLSKTKDKRVSIQWVILESKKVPAGHARLEVRVLGQVIRFPEIECGFATGRDEDCLAYEQVGSLPKGEFLLGWVSFDFRLMIRAMEFFEVYFGKEGRDTMRGVSFRFGKDLQLGPCEITHSQDSSMRVILMPQKQDKPRNLEAYL